MSSDLEPCDYIRTVVCLNYSIFVSWLVIIYFIEPRGDGNMARRYRSSYL